MIEGGPRADYIQVMQTGGGIAVLGVTSFPLAKVQRVIIDGNGGNDWIDARTVILPTTIHGDAGNDTIFGGPRSIVGGGLGTNYLDGAVSLPSTSGVDFLARQWAAHGYRAADLMQGGAGDCSIFATEYGLFLRGAYPDIRYLGYGRYYVHLGGGPGSDGITQTVTFLGFASSSEAQYAPGNFTGLLIERAASQSMGGNLTMWPDEWIQVLYGVEPDTRWGFGGADWYAYVRIALAQGHTVVVSTFDGAVDHHLVGGHAYTLTVAATNGLVTGRNPWGVDGMQPSGNPNDGFVTLPFPTWQRSIDQTMVF